MRLLHLDQHDTLICTNFVGKAIPPYAILSHRWANDEVLYEDVINRTYQSKPDGYKKIAFCAKQVAQDGLAYFWIDSCCIDKSNRRERSRAISSMFAWYKAAAKCYVYLSDVSAPTKEDAQDRTGWEASFRKSIWHTRGWTLQELIAPSSVDFFSVEGQRLGTRADLAQILVEITSIPLPVIYGGSLATFSIDEWKEWGKDRKSKEPEDRAYCLLGILGVYLPLSYGEGEAKAMQRLREVLQNSNTLSTIPFSRNDGFVGRESELVDLEAMLAEGTQIRRVGVVGEGGTGKTQLTLELAYRMRKKDKGLATFWVDAGDADSFQLGCMSIAQTLDIAGWDDESADAGQLVKAQLEREDGRRWLLVLDNVESIAFGSRQLVDYLPRSASGTVIFTSTEREAAEMLGVDAMVELRQMTEAAARDLVTACLPELDSDAQRAETTQLLSELGHLPLAIAQAAAYIRSKTGTTAHAYRQQLTAQQHQLDRGEHDEGSEHEHSCGDSVVTTLMVSLELLQRERPLAVGCLAIAACVDRKDIPLDLLDLLGTASPLREQAVENLREFGLITRRPADDSFDVHRLVHEALRRWLREANAFDRWLHKLTARLVEIFPNSSAGNRGKWRRLLPHTRYVLKSGQNSILDEDSGGLRMRQSSLRQYGAGSKKEAQDELMRKCADALYYDGRWQEAEELQVRVMETSKRVLGENHPHTLTSMNNLALTWRSTGRETEALALITECAQLLRQTLGSDHPNTRTTIETLRSWT